MRLEPDPHSDGIEFGLQAAIHDPLWMLARQWQLGEFQGEDVGSPIEARLHMTATPLTKYAPGTLHPGNSLPLDRNIPLEAVLEREVVRRDPTNDGVSQVRLAVEAGLQFLRLLSGNGTEQQRSFIVSTFPLRPPAVELRQPLDADAQRFLLVMSGRAPDGRLLYAVLKAIRGNTAESSVSPEVKTGIQAWKGWNQATNLDVQTAVTAWLAWYEHGLFCEPPPQGNPSWLEDRMEYAATVSCPPSGDVGEVTLAAPEYTDGYLDWYSFDVLAESSLNAKRTDLTDDEKKREVLTAPAIPVPITFRGMPVSRYWEFEDARVDFGEINAGPQQLAMLLLVQFGLVAGDDWYVIPVVVPVGTLCRTNWLVVLDTFGEYTLVPSARKVDSGIAAPVQAHLPWDLWRLSMSNPSDGKLSDALFLPPTLGEGLHGAPVEEVLFLRDEMANIAWAVERIVEGALGTPINRSEEYFRSRKARPTPAATNADSSPNVMNLMYRLSTEVPPHWVPLIPAPQNGGPQIWLTREARWKDGIHGQILEPNRDKLNLHEEEVPREGARVVRAFQLARWTGGETYLWMGRRKGVGRREGSSGLQFDVLVPSDQTESR